MKSPFPGMDPYLEAPDIFPDFHNRLAMIISDLLNEHMPKPYYARLEHRSDVGIVHDGHIRHRIVPDVAVMRPLPHVHEPAPHYPAGVAVAEPRTITSPSLHVYLHDEPYLHPFIEIRDAARGHKLVTLIEIVSPSNKRPGPDRRAYQTKQAEVLGSDANLIEIDWLRDGERLLLYPELSIALDQNPYDYVVTLNRGKTRLEYTLFPCTVREILPCIPVPLADDTPDVLLDLQVAFERVYLSGPYARMIDYAQEPRPPLTADDAVWADTLLKAVGLRPPPSPPADQ